jgi:hypothetical protein
MAGWSPLMRMGYLFLFLFPSPSCLPLLLTLTHEKKKESTHFSEIIYMSFKYREGFSG